MPGLVHFGHVDSNWPLQIPQTSSWGSISGHFHTATGTHCLITTFMVLGLCKRKQCLSPTCAL